MSVGSLFLRKSSAYLTGFGVFRVNKKREYISNRDIGSFADTCVRLNSAESLVSLHVSAESEEYYFVEMQLEESLHVSYLLAVNFQSSWEGTEA